MRHWQSAAFVRWGQFTICTLWCPRFNSADPQTLTSGVLTNSSPKGTLMRKSGAIVWLDTDLRDLFVDREDTCDFTCFSRVPQSADVAAEAPGRSRRRYVTRPSSPDQMTADDTSSSAALRAGCDMTFSTKSVLRNWEPLHEKLRRDAISWTGQRWRSNDHVWFSFPDKIFLSRARAGPLNTSIYHFVLKVPESWTQSFIGFYKRGKKKSIKNVLISACTG